MNNTERKHQVTHAELKAIAIAYDELVSYYETVGIEGDLDEEELPSGLIPWAIKLLHALLEREEIDHRPHYL